MATSGWAGAIWTGFYAQRVRGRVRAGRAFLGMSLACATAGCSTSIDTYLVDPGRYSAYHCKDLVEQLKELQKNQNNLRDLMDKASEGGGGTVIGGMSYQAKYEKVVGEEKLLRQTAAEKKCALERPAFESDQIIR